MTGEYWCCDLHVVEMADDAVQTAALPLSISAWVPRDRLDQTFRKAVGAMSAWMDWHGRWPEDAQFGATGSEQYDGVQVVFHSDDPELSRWTKDHTVFVHVDKLVRPDHVRKIAKRRVRRCSGHRVSVGEGGTEVRRIWQAGEVVRSSWRRSIGSCTGCTEQLPLTVRQGWVGVADLRGGRCPGFVVAVATLVEWQTSNGRRTGNWNEPSWSCWSNVLRTRRSARPTPRAQCTRGTMTAGAPSWSRPAARPGGSSRLARWTSLRVDTLSTQRKPAVRSASAAADTLRSRCGGAIV